MELNDPALASFIDVAPDSHFPIQNLPFGIFSSDRDPGRRVGVAIGAFVLDLAELERSGLLLVAGGNGSVFDAPSLNRFLALGRNAWRATRRRISTLLRRDNPELRDDASLREHAFFGMERVRMHLPVEPGGYTDFYSSKEHATNVGAMFREPARALLPNWLELPVAYNGRASSIVVSGTPLRRPCGLIAAGDERPAFGPTRKLDFELETAFVVGTGNALGEPIALAQAERHIFGLVLMNDWSARDIQQFEYAPLGPFNGKSFGTSISPWIVTLDALEPFRVAGQVQDPLPARYLRQQGARAFDIALEAGVRRHGASRPTRVCRTNFKYLYWSMAQQLAHHTSSGCNTRPGDLMGSGTISGPEAGSQGSLLELTRNGSEPLALDDGTSRTFLEDGDEISISGCCNGAYRIGFGAVTGRIVPAHAL